MKASLSSSLLLTATISAANAETTRLDTIGVYSSSPQQKKERLLKLKDSIVHTEIVNKAKIERKQAASLAQAIEEEPGIKVNTDCSMCGVKRVMINGLKGEHTTILSNGIANSSLMEGFYGFDSIPTAGISEVEISRGAGASLIAPEAIGGVVNVVSRKPTDNGLMFDLSHGDNDYQKYQFEGSQVSKDKKTAFRLAAQSDHRGQVDTDNNWVNESPALTNKAMNLHIWHQPTEIDKVDFRIDDQQSEVFGGPVLGTPFAKSKSDARTQANGSSPNFVGNHVANKPDQNTTNGRDFLENIVTTKKAYTAKWSRDVNDDLQTQVAFSYVDAQLDSIYENITYIANQDIYYLDAKADYFLNEEHALTVGLDFKLDNYNSSQTGGMQKTAGDSYDLTTNGFYIRDIWTASNSLELSAALRLDKIDVKFNDQNRSFDDTIIAPRLHAKYTHDLSWTSRFSAGQGYRVPLAFFETDHGIVDNPLVMAVDKLEKSDSLQYSLEFNGAQTSFEGSYSWAAVDNLAMIDDSDANNTRIINSQDTGNVQHLMLTGTYQLTDHWLLGATVESFMYDKNYRETFGVIPTEERIMLSADYEGHGWDIATSFTWNGSRNYKDYPSADYLNHFKDSAGTESNGTSSPDYYTVNFKASKSLSKTWTAYGGVNNLFDYTQTGEGSSPLFYADAGTANAAPDVTHLWGPLRGREIYLGIKANF